MTYYDQDGNEISIDEILNECHDWDIEKEYESRGLGSPDNSVELDQILFDVHESYIELMKELHNSDKTHFNVLVGRMEKLFDEYRSIY